MVKTVVKLAVMLTSKFNSTEREHIYIFDKHTMCQLQNVSSQL